MKPIDGDILQMAPGAHLLTPYQLALLQRRAARAQRAGHLCRIRPQIVLAFCAYLVQAEAQVTELAETYQRLVEEHDVSTADWVRLLELLGLSAWSPWSTASETVVTKVEVLVCGVPPTPERDAATDGGSC